MIINNDSFEFSLQDTTILRNLILENPNLPLLVFAGEEAWSGEYSYEQVDARTHGVQELTLYKNRWIDKDDYEEELRDDLSYNEEYKKLSYEEYDKMINKIVEETEFCRAIVVYVG